MTLILIEKASFNDIFTLLGLSYLLLKLSKFLKYSKGERFEKPAVIKIGLKLSNFDWQIA